MNFKKNWKRFWTLSSAREGFTLVELIVVIAILAILAGVAVPAYSGYVKKANMQADMTLASEVAHALTLYYYSHPDEVVSGYVVLSTSGASGDGVVGDAAMDAVFGENWEDTAVLKYDGWQCRINNVSAAIAGSSYITVGTENLLGDVQYCAGSLAEFLRGGYEGKAGAETLDQYLGGTYVSDYLANLDDSEITADVLANAAVFGIANQLNQNSEDVYNNFANGTYLLNNWDSEYNPNGYDESNRLNYIDGDDSTLLSDVANTYAALEAFSAYMGIPLELEFDPADASMAIVADVANECQRVLDAALVSNPTKMTEYLAGQAATDAEAYISIMQSVNDIKGDFTSDLTNTNLFANDKMLNRVNSYVAVSQLGDDVLAQLQTALGTVSGSAMIVVLDASSGNTYIIPAE